jgi:hypothetical protein
MKIKNPKLKRIKNILLAVITYVIIVISVTPVTHAESAKQKLQVQNKVCVMKIYNITNDLITFEDNTGNLWSCYGDLKNEYKGQYALVVLQIRTGQNYKDTKLVDYILKDDIPYMDWKRIKDVLNL